MPGHPPADLASRKQLPVNSKGALSIKRDVRDLVVSTDAATLAGALHEVMRDSTRRFGLIRVDRMPENVGKPFHLHERFQGRYELAKAIRQELHGFWKKLFGPLLDDPGVGKILEQIENGHTSDYGEIVRFELDSNSAGPFVLQYVYLAGSPIAGSSTFEVSDVTDPAELLALGVPKAALVRQIFVYQEQSVEFAKFFSAGGLRLHNQVVYSQIEQSAQVAGASILKTDIPKD